MDITLTLYLPSALIIASSLESKAASPGQNGGERVGYHRNSTACDVKHVGEEWELGMRVLLIEDDSATAQSIELMLEAEGFNVYTTDLGEEGIDLGKVYDYDIILLDLNLPDMSGFEVLRSLRVSKVKTPILILSGIPGIEDKVRGLGFGADDYMTKPFHKDELVARIHAIVRRSKGHAQSVIQTGDLVVNLDTKTVEVNGAGCI